MRCHDNSICLLTQFVISNFKKSVKMQQAINAFTETIFPGIHVFEKDELRIMNKEVLQNHLTSNLPLQIALYYNSIYFPFWIIITSTMLILKFSYLHPVYQVVFIVILSLASVVEVIRLYAGYLGNLSEMIPELAGFWILSLLLQLPIQAFLLLNERNLILPTERAANIIMLSFVTFELITGYFAIKKISKQLATKFHLETFSLAPPNT